jgi:peptidyl-prolyl cis-trans isomerase B (cyclophilin B)
MKRLALLVPIIILLTTSCGGSGKKAAMGCEIGGDKSKAELAKLETGKTYKAAVNTNKGTFTIEFATKSSPCTTASFIGLAEKGFFNGLIFHRIVPGFVIQGGDPQGNGMGGPGYSTVDMPPTDTTYKKGLVAMAKAGNEPPGTSGSQFFVVTGDKVSLPPDYAVLGKVVDGLGVVEKIGQLGDAQEHPTERVEIKSIKITTS